MSKRKKGKKAIQKLGPPSYRFHVIYWNGKELVEDDASAASERVVFSHLVGQSSFFKIEQKERIQ